MSEYRYNIDTRVTSEFRSFDEIKATDKWKNDNSKYMFIRYLPNFYEGFDDLIITFDDLDKFKADLENIYVKNKVTFFKDGDSHYIITAERHGWNCVGDIYLKTDENI